MGVRCIWRRFSFKTGLFPAFQHEAYFFCSARVPTEVLFRQVDFCCLRAPDDRRNNAMLFEDAFYSGAGKDPTKQDPESQPEAAPAADVSADTATLLKLLQNPEMAALLKTLAKSL